MGSMEDLMIVSGSLGSMQKESMFQNRLKISRKKNSQSFRSINKDIQSNSIYCCKKNPDKISNH